MKEHFTFKGHATRKSYWLNFLSVIGINVAAGMVMIAAVASESDAAIIFTGIPGLVLMLGAVVSSWSYLVRRTRDAGYSGLLSLLVLIPYVGIVPHLYFTLTSKSITNGTIEEK